MCNINILLRKNSQIERNKIASFIQSVTSHSYASNNHGEGFYANGKLIKGIYKIDYCKYKNLLEDSKLIITHQRFATSGHSPIYTQPFASKEFVLVHNGIMNDFVKGESSDTWGFFNRFMQRFEKEKGNIRKQKIIKVLKGLLKNNPNYCSYSIAILDKIENVIYYLKNFLTDIHFYKNNKLLFITTNEGNKHILEIFNSQNFEEIEIEDNKIYSIDEELNISAIARIPVTSYFEQKNIAYYFK